MRALCGFLMVMIVLGLSAAEYDIPRETESARQARMAWWTHDRFGMFIHFGLYSVAGRHEWLKSKEQMSDADYDGRYLRHFDPKRLDCRKWARAAKAAGMKYAVLTAKHHEGFCLWDTKTTDYKSTATPFGRDVVREYADAFRAEGIRVGLYYSVIDWHHPDYTVDLVNHPQRGLNWEVFKKLSGEDPAALEPYRQRLAKLNEGRDMSRYRAYMFEQVRELLTDYGRIDIMWFDFSFPQYETGKGRKDWHSEELLTLARTLQPGIIVDNRLDLNDDPCGYDFLTPEQTSLTKRPTMHGKPVAWETCQTFSGSWGYYRDELTWKSEEQIIAQLPRTVALGGNLIMNVGPNGRGEIDSRAMSRLAAYGKWMEANGESIYGCTAAPEAFEPPAGTVMTYNPKTNRLYVHVLEWPIKSLAVRFWDRIEYAQFLHDGSEVAVEKPKWRLDQCGDDRTAATGVLSLPVFKPDVVVPVIEIFLK